MSLPLRCAALISLLATLACSHNVTSDLPTSPTPGPTVAHIVKLTVTPPGGGSMLVGTTVPITTSGPLPSSGLAFGAFAQYNDGTGKYVDAAWTSSDPAVALVRDGSLVALARGEVTLTASADGMSATEKFTVDPGIPGAWAGTYVVDSCQAGSASMMELICNPTPTGAHDPGILPVGKAAPIALQINQTGKDLTAAAQLGELRGVLTGTDRGGNFLTLTGNVSVNRTTVSLVYWDSRVKIDTMEGFIGFEVRIDGVPSYAAVTAHFDGMTRR